jgi:hypothetical protein
MRHPSETRLPDWIRTAYETLEPAYTADTDELPRERAHELLLADAEHIEDSGDATYVIDCLLERGWLYEVNGQLRKTD